MMSQPRTEALTRPAEQNPTPSSSGWQSVVEILPSVLAAIQAQAAQLQHDRPVDTADRGYFVWRMAA